MLLVPPGVVMLTVLAVSAAVDEMVKVAVALVGLVTERPLTVTPVPETVTLLAPVRLVPVKVTVTLVPWRPVVGAIVVKVGAGGATTEMLRELLAPPVPVTLMLRVPPVVPIGTVYVAVIVVVPVRTKLDMVTPVGLILSPVAPPRFVPVTVNVPVVPRTSVEGTTDVIVGRSTVKVTVLLVPPGVVMLTFPAPAVA